MKVSNNELVMASLKHLGILVETSGIILKPYTFEIMNGTLKGAHNLKVVEWAKLKIGEFHMRQIEAMALLGLTVAVGSGCSRFIAYTMPEVSRAI